jgi:hypothetical protein
MPLRATPMLGAILACVLLSPITVVAQEANQAEIDAVRTALDKYKDPYVAIKDLYLSTEACVHYDGSTEEGHLNYNAGAMGVHFVNLTIQGLDPMKPNVLVYEPQEDGTLELVAAEWLVPKDATGGQVPSLFGHEFQGPMEGHEPLIPAGFHHYDMHVWFWRDNPYGMFTPTNSNVTCDHGHLVLLEKPTKMVN